MESLKNKACCKACGQYIPLIRRLSISSYSGIRCPNCGCYLTFKPISFVVFAFLALLLFPSFYLLFEKDRLLLGGAMLMGVVALSIWTALVSEFKIQRYGARRDKG